MKPVIKRMSCILLAVVSFPFPLENAKSLVLIVESKPIVQTGDIHIHQTFVFGSNNTIRQ